MLSARVHLPERFVMFFKSLCMLTAALVSSAALANESKRTPLPGCATEISTYCQGVEKGRGRIAKCLRDNKDRLGEACKADIEDLMAQMKERREERRGKGRGEHPGNQ
jgi:hypothetical protein